MARLTEEKNKLRWILIREFTKHLIINSKKEEFIRKPIIVRKEQPKKKQYEIKQNLMMASPRTRFNENVFQNLAKQDDYPKNIKPAIGAVNLGKLNLLISDPRVKEIDCYGPNREMLVKIGNSTQKTKISLSQEEITSIIKDFSEKTRIPLMKGVFKAALGNIIITAFISDFVETKFTIQKRTPFEPLLPSGKANS